MSKMRMQPMGSKRIFANHISGKGLISNIYKNLYILTAKANKQAKKKNQTQTTQLKNGQRTQIEIFSKETHKWPTGTWKDAHYQ